MPNKLQFGLFTLLLYAVNIGMWYGLYTGGIQDILNYVTVTTIIYLGSVIVVCFGIYSGGRIKIKDKKQSKYILLDNGTE